MPIIAFSSQNTIQDTDSITINIVDCLVSDTGIGREDYTVSWNYVRSLESNYKVVVDILVPDFTKKTKIEKIVKSIAKTLVEQPVCEKHEVFMNIRKADTVYDGKLVEF